MGLRVTTGVLNIISVNERSRLHYLSNRCLKNGSRPSDVLPVKNWSVSPRKGKPIEPGGNAASSLLRRPLLFRFSSRWNSHAVIRVTPMTTTKGTVVPVAAPSTQLDMFNSLKTVICSGSDLLSFKLLVVGFRDCALHKCVYIAHVYIGRARERGVCSVQSSGLYIYVPSVLQSV